MRFQRNQNVRSLKKLLRLLGEGGAIDAGLDVSALVEAIRTGTVEPGLVRQLLTRQNRQSHT